MSSSVAQAAQGLARGSPPSPRRRGPAAGPSRRTGMASSRTPSSRPGTCGRSANRGAGQRARGVGRRRAASGRGADGGGVDDPPVGRQQLGEALAALDQPRRGLGRRAIRAGRGRATERSWARRRSSWSSASGEVAARAARRGTRRCRPAPAPSPPRTRRPPAPGSAAASRHRLDPVADAAHGLDRRRGRTGRRSCRAAGARRRR